MSKQVKTPSIVVYVETGIPCAFCDTGIIFVASKSDGKHICECTDCSHSYQLRSHNGCPTEQASGIDAGHPQGNRP